MSFDIKKYAEHINGTQVQPGDKLFFEGKRSCLKMQEKLNNSGIETRIVCDEGNKWYVYIISVPYENGRISVYDGCGLMKIR